MSRIGERTRNCKAKWNIKSQRETNNALSCPTSPIPWLFGLKCPIIKLQTRHNLFESQRFISVSKSWELSINRTKTEKTRDRNEMLSEWARRSHFSAQKQGKYEDMGIKRTEIWHKIILTPQGIRSSSTFRGFIAAYQKYPSAKFRSYDEEYKSKTDWNILQLNSNIRGFCLCKNSLLLYPCISSPQKRTSPSLILSSHDKYLHVAAI